MECPVCRADSDVIDSRATEHGNGIRRRRKCQSCDCRFTTYELVENAEARHREKVKAFADDLRRMIDRFEEQHTPYRHEHMGGK